MLLHSEHLTTLLARSPQIKKLIYYTDEQFAIQVDGTVEHQFYDNEGEYGEWFTADVWPNFTAFLAWLCEGMEE